MARDKRLCTRCESRIDVEEIRIVVVNESNRFRTCSYFVCRECRQEVPLDVWVQAIPKGRMRPTIVVDPSVVQAAQERFAGSSLLRPRGEQR